MSDKLDELGGTEAVKDYLKPLYHVEHDSRIDCAWCREEALIARVESLQSDLSGKEALISGYKDTITKLQAEIERNGKRVVETVGMLQKKVNTLERGKAMGDKPTDWIAERFGKWTELSPTHTCYTSHEIAFRAGAVIATERLMAELKPLRELRNMISDAEFKGSISCPGCIEVLKDKAREAEAARTARKGMRAMPGYYDPLKQQPGPTERS